MLFLLGLRWLPKRVVAGNPRVAARAMIRRGRDLVLALVAGAGLAALSYAMLTRPAPQSISPFFLDRALPEGGGANVVNVMLVDFRGFDTLGEITVLGGGGADRLRAAAAIPAAIGKRQTCRRSSGRRAHVATDLVDATCARRCANWAT